MIVVDSNCWADFFNGTFSSHVQRLETALRQEEDLAVMPGIVTEVLQGCRTDNGFERVRQVLLSLPVIQPTVDCHVRAARLFRYLRSRGIPVRGEADCVIAQTCIDLDVELLSPDTEFERIADQTDLRLWRS